MNTEYYDSMSKEALEKEKADLQARYDAYKAQGLNLNMSRGKPDCLKCANFLAIY